MGCAVNMFPIAGLLHALFGLWCFGRQALFPSDWSVWTPLFERILDVDREIWDQNQQDYLTGMASNGELVYEYIAGRALDTSRQGSWPLLAIFCLFVLYYVLMFLWLYILAPLLRPFLIC